MPTEDYVGHEVSGVQKRKISENEQPPILSAVAARKLDELTSPQPHVIRHVEQPR